MIKIYHIGKGDMAGKKGEKRNIWNKVENFIGIFSGDSLKKKKKTSVISLKNNT